MEVVRTLLSTFRSPAAAPVDLSSEALPAVPDATVKHARPVELHLVSQISPAMLDVYLDSLASRNDQQKRIRSMVFEGEQRSAREHVEALLGSDGLVRADVLQPDRQRVLDKFDTEQFHQSLMHSFACTGPGATSTIIKMDLAILLKVYGSDRTRIYIAEEIPELAGASSVVLHAPDGRFTCSLQGQDSSVNTKLYYLDMYDGFKNEQKLHSLVVLKAD